MKRLLLPLLAALALPSAVNAEVIYLACYGEALMRRQPISYFTATVNENTGTAVVDGGSAKLFGSKVPSRGVVVSTPSEFVVTTGFNSDFEEVITINRYNGEYLMRRQSKEFAFIGDDMSKGTCTKQTPTNRAF
tara:strand:+ start:167 stop:568 length:402 start_codon:yes stop_codon:yes gene_type:complete